MPNYQPSEGLKYVIEEIKKPKKKLVGGALNTENDADKFIEDMKEKEITFKELHKMIEKEKDCDCDKMEGGSFEKIVSKIKNMNPLHHKTLKDISSHIWTLNKKDFHKGVLTDIVKTKNPKHLGEVMEKDKEFVEGNDSGNKVNKGQFFDTLEKVMKIASNII